MDEVLRDLISRVEHEQPIFRADEVARWPKGAHQRLVDAGFLRDGPRAQSIFYDGCDDGCMAEPELIEGPPGKSIYAFWCSRDECDGLITVDPACMRTWEVCLPEFVSHVATGLHLVGSVTEVVSGRIWLLGTMPSGGGPMDVFLARGLTWNDATTISKRADRLQASAAPVVLVPRQIEPDFQFGRVSPTVLTLTELTAWNTTETKPDFSQLASVVASLRPSVPADSWLTVTQASQLLCGDLPYVDTKKAMARVSKAADDDKFVTNGMKRSARRIERVSFDAWRLAQRDRDLDEADRRALLR